MTKTARVDIVAKIEGARGAAMLVAVDVLQAAGIQPGATVRVTSATRSNRGRTISGRPRSTARTI